jgi:Leucine-rich repeat (LRR) protein
MKKLLLISVPLLCLSLLTLFNSCSNGGDVPTPNNIPTLQSTIVDQIWELKTKEYRFNLHNNGELYEKDLICDEFSLTGWWSLDNDKLTLTRQEGPLEISETITVTSFSANEIKFNVFTDSTTIIEEVYISVEPVIRGCMESNSSNYNIDAVCPTRCDKTYVPDDVFEQYLIELGVDDVLDDSVSSTNIATITYLDVEASNGNNDLIENLTGIEDFRDLTRLYCGHNQLTYLDVSQNTALTELYCGDNQLTNLDLSQNTALNLLYCEYNQFTSLDLSQNTALTHLYCAYNQLTNLDVSQNTALTRLYCGDNQLTNLDVSQNTALTRLYCAYNQLTNLDVSNNTALTVLRCEDNNLTSLDVRNGNNMNFTYFNPGNNTNLYCISVDDSLWSSTAWSDWSHIDSQMYFSEDCSNK